MVGGNILKVSLTISDILLYRLEFQYRDSLERYPIEGIPITALFERKG